MSNTLPPAHSAPPSPAASIASGDDKFHWTPGKICLSLFLFLVAGLLEIGGGWLVWQTIRWVAVMKGVESGGHACLGARSSRAAL
jgi:Uncharacterised BCR, YnfA/UPF0060 family